MRNFFRGLLALSTALLLASCGSNPVEPNKEGVLMSNYGRNGKADFRAVTGAQGILGPGSELYQVPMWEQKADPVSVGITARDGGYFTVDPTYSYQPARGKGVEIVFNYRHVGLDDEKIMDRLESQILDPLVLNAYREEARNYTTDSLLNNVGVFEKAVEARLANEFEGKFFTVNSLTSGLKPPASMIEAIEKRNNRKLEAEEAFNQLAIARTMQEKARIEAETNRIQSQGLTREVLTEKWIDAILRSQNRIVITDGKTPVLIGGQ